MNEAASFRKHGEAPFVSVVWGWAFDFLRRRSRGDRLGADE